MNDSHAEAIRELFAREIPEVAAGIVQIKAIAREVGYLSKVAVASREEGLDAVALCVGDRGSRLRGIVNALDGERLDLIRWSEDVERLVRNALQPADLAAVVISPASRRATVFAESDQQPLLLGRRNLNRELAERLTGYEIVVETIASRRGGRR
jgi:N utilization substance protein A